MDLSRDGVSHRLVSGRPTCLKVRLPSAVRRPDQQGEAVTGFAGSDVTFAGSTVGGTLAATVAGTGANYTVSVTGMTGDGTVIASIAARSRLPRPSGCPRNWMMH